MCRSRRELSNGYSLAKFGIDTAENEPCKVCPLSVYRSPRYLHSINIQHRDVKASNVFLLCRDLNWPHAKVGLGGKSVFEMMDFNEGILLLLIF